jgi:hypothetical protein
VLTFLDNCKYFLLVSIIAAAAQATPPKPNESLELSCNDKAYVGVFAETRDRKTSPSVGLKLIDPSGRAQGQRQKGSSEAQIIPNSHYGDIVRLPGSVFPTSARAIEVCDAAQGVYELTLRERGIEPYRLAVTAHGKVDTMTLHLDHVSLDGRVREYRFSFHIERDQVSLSWLDHDGKPQTRVEDGEWGRQ